MFTQSLTPYTEPMKKFDIDCELTYDVTQQTVFMVNVCAPTDETQMVYAESIRTTPPLVIEPLLNSGSPNRVLRIDVPPGPFNVSYLAQVAVNRPEPDHNAPELAVADLPPEVMPYLTPSRYCESDVLYSFATQHFGGLYPGYGRVSAICRWIHDNIRYTIGSSQTLSTAKNALDAGAGVCRDFAHIGIALCRALNIPARIVTGYARYNEPPADFHAVFEAYLGRRWILFDPTELSPVSDLVRIGVGVDASEVAFATFFGTARLRYLCPLIEPARNMGAHVLVALQRPGAGIALAA
jgi:transglutaminase-like putative cysteine protease